MCRLSEVEEVENVIILSHFVSLEGSLASSAEVLYRRFIQKVIAQVIL